MIKGRRVVGRPRGREGWRQGLRAREQPRAQGQRRQETLNERFDDRVLLHLLVRSGTVAGVLLDRSETSMCGAERVATKDASLLLTRVGGTDRELAMRDNQACSESEV